MCRKKIQKRTKQDKNLPQTQLNMFQAKAQQKAQQKQQKNSSNETHITCQINWP